MSKYPGEDFSTYIRTERWFYDDLIQVEAERIVLNALVVVKAHQKFTYYERTVCPVVPYVKDGYYPPESLNTKDRLKIALKRTSRYLELQNLYGKSHVWLGPKHDLDDSIEGLSESEQRGFWVRVDQKHNQSNSS